MDKYYQRAKFCVENKDVEGALDCFVAGLERGHIKCAYGIVHAVTTYGSPTMTDEEAISIYNASYEKIKLLAEEGDTEAMVMVADGIRYGFVEDDDEPYSYWLEKAAEGGCREALVLLEADTAEEAEEEDGPWMQPVEAPTISDEVRESLDATDALLIEEDAPPSDYINDGELEALQNKEHVLIDDSDSIIHLQYGIIDHYKRKKERFELRKCRDDLDVEDYDADDDDE